MPAQWFACPYLRRDFVPGRPRAYLVIDGFTTDIQVGGGNWSEFQCGGGPGTSYTLAVAVAKVGGAPQNVLDAIAATSGVMAIPTKLLELDTSMSVTSNAEKAVIRDQIGRELGYTDQEIADWLGVAVGASTNQKNQALNAKTFGQFLDFLATRRYSAVYEPEGTQVGHLGVVYPGVLACDGRTTSTGQTSVPVPTSNTPAQVAATVPST